MDVGDRAPKSGGRCLPRDPGHAGSLAAIPVLCISPDRRRRGADPLPRGGRGRRHRPAVRRPRARGAGRGAAAPLPALARPRAARSPPTAPRLRARRSMVACLQPQGRRRDHDDRDQHRHLAAAPARRAAWSLVDLDLQFGQVATHLNLKPAADARRRARDEPALREAGAAARRTRCSTQRAPRPGGARPPEAGGVITPDAGRPGLLGTLRRLRRGGGRCRLRASTSGSWRSSSAPKRSILPVVPEIAALKALHSLLEYLAEEGSVGAKSTFVLNNLFAREILTMSDRERPRGQVGVELPVRPGPLPQGGQRGQPGRPRRAAVAGCRALRPARPGGQRLAGARPGGRTEERRSGLFGGLRRRS